MTEQVLVVEFLDDEWCVDHGETLTFGRSGDVVLDADNEFLHRVVGVLSWRHGVWMLDHVGTRTQLTVAGGRTVSTIEPGGSIALVADENVVRCVAGAAHYELVVALDLPPSELDHPRNIAGATTVDYGWVSLNEEQRQLLAALAARTLRRPDHAADLPANRVVAHRLGWSITKFNRKLDHLCASAHRSGVVGVAGDLGRLATQRRARLVEHAVRVGLVTLDDVERFGFGDL